jgi:Tol biopolymer transport system component
MRMPEVQFNLRRVMIVAMVCLNGCFASKGEQIEHDNVAFAVSPDGQNIVFSAADGDLYSLSVEGQRVTRLTKTESRESSPSFSPDGKEIIYSSNIKGREGTCIFLRTLDGKQTRQLTDNPDVADALSSFSPDGKRIAFTRAYRHRPYSMGGWTWDHFDVCVMNRDGSNLRRVTAHNYYQLGRPSFIEADKTLLFAVQGEEAGALTDLYLAPSDGSQEPKLLTTPPPAGTKAGAWASGQSVSADGRLIAFVSDRLRSYNYDICLMSIGGADVRSLGVTTVSRYNQQPTFMPDGKSIMFLAGTENNASSRPIFSLWTVGIDGSKPVRIAESKLFTDPIHWPAVEPDSAKPE